MQIAIRTVHYLAYHVAMGMSGLLLYTDAVQRHYLRRVPALQPYLTAGHLRCGKRLPYRSLGRPNGRGHRCRALCRATAGRRL